MGTVFAVNTDGSGFTNLHTFTSLSNGSYGTNYDGGYPFAGVILSSTTLYGVANSGGNLGQGTLFSMQNDGSGFTVLHSFNGGIEEGYPSGLVLSGSTLYGTTYGSGANNTWKQPRSVNTQLTLSFGAGVPPAAAPNEAVRVCDGLGIEIVRGVRWREGAGRVSPGRSLDHISRRSRHPALEILKTPVSPAVNIDHIR